MFFSNFATEARMSVKIKYATTLMTATWICGKHDITIGLEVLKIIGLSTSLPDSD